MERVNQGQGSMGKCIPGPGTDCASHCEMGGAEELGRINEWLKELMRACATWNREERLRIGSGQAT